jgi:ADP-heptose:LPS heptosyltransferase
MVQRAVNNGWAGVARFGGIGDHLIASSVLPGLKKRYGHVEVLSQEPQHVVFINNPYMDKLSVHRREDLDQNTAANWHWIRAKEFEFYINLSHSIETSLVFFGPEAGPAAQYQFQWPQEARRKIANKSYLELVHDIALVPYDEIAPNFFPTEDEVSEAQATKQRLGGRFIVWALRGSRIDKAYPYAPLTIARLIQETGRPVVLLGAARDLELAIAIHHDLIEITGDPAGLKEAISGNNGTIRRTLALAQQADLVIGPDTGVLWACAMRGMPKIVLLSHASPENITKHWLNTTSLHADAGRVDCWPCHRLHSSWATCRPNSDKTAAACMSDISVQTVVQAALQALAHEC